MAARDWTDVATHVEIHVLMMDGWSPYIRSQMWGKPGHTPKGMTEDQIVILDWVQDLREERMVQVGPAQSYGKATEYPEGYLPPDSSPSSL